MNCLFTVQLTHYVELMINNVGNENHCYTIFFIVKLFLERSGLYRRYGNDHLEISTLTILSWQCHFNDHGA